MAVATRNRRDGTARGNGLYRTQALIDAVVAELAVTVIAQALRSAVNDHAVV